MRRSLGDHFPVLRRWARSLRAHRDIAAPLVVLALGPPVMSMGGVDPGGWVWGAWAILLVLLLPFVVMGLWMAFAKSVSDRL